MMLVSVQLERIALISLNDAIPVLRAAKAAEAVNSCVLAEHQKQCGEQGENPEVVNLRCHHSFLFSHCRILWSFSSSSIISPHSHLLRTPRFVFCLQ